MEQHQPTQHQPEIIDLTEEEMDQIERDIQIYEIREDLKTMYQRQITMLCKWLWKAAKELPTFNPTDEEIESVLNDYNLWNKLAEITLEIEEDDIISVSSDME